MIILRQSGGVGGRGMFPPIRELHWGRLMRKEKTVCCVTRLIEVQDTEPIPGDKRRRTLVKLGRQLYIAQDPKTKMDCVYSCHMLVDRRAGPGEGKRRNEPAPPELAGPLKIIMNILKRKKNSDDGPGEGASRQRDTGAARSPIYKE